MQNQNEWLRLPDDPSLEAGEDSTTEESRGSYESSWVPPKLEPKAQANFNGRHESACEADGPLTIYPEEARGQCIWEVFEGPDECLLDRDPENGVSYLREGFHVEELAEEAEERAERFMAAQRQLAAAFFARRRNSLYRQAATDALAEPQQPEPKLLLLWNLLGDRCFDADAGTQEEVSQWLSGLSEEDFLFFTQDPDGDPQRVMSAGVLPADLRPMRLFEETRRRLMRVLIKESSFFHPDQGMFEEKLREKIPQIARAWDLDEAKMFELAREERAKFYRLHLAVCKAAAAFARGKPAPVSVMPEVVADVAAVAYGRMNHPDYKVKALAFAGIEEDQARALFARLDRFMEEFYASRLFSFIKRAGQRRRVQTSGVEPAVAAFVKSFRTGIRPKGIDDSLARQVAALALFETYYGGFRGHSASFGRPHTRCRPQIFSWGGFADLDEARQVHEAIPDREVLRRVLFPAIATMAREDRLRRAGALLDAARRAYLAWTKAPANSEKLEELRASIGQFLGTFGEQDVCRIPVLASLKKSLRYLEKQTSRA